jgi:SAM-dependent methyltransferase
LQKPNNKFQLEIIDETIDYKSLIDLAQLFFCKVINIDKNFITLQKLSITSSFHNDSGDDLEKKYGENSQFSLIDKLNKPSFLHYYLQALQNVNLEKRKKILNLGVNQADEFEVIKSHCKNFQELELLGIDYSKSAIEIAKEKFKDDPNVVLKAGDINHLDTLGLEKYDLIISIGTLQSSGINLNEKFMEIVQNYLKKEGSLILGFPNCRWYEDEMIYGAKAKNYNFSEMSLLFKDVIFCKKYLQQKKFRVTITGKEYIFLTATSIR